METPGAGLQAASQTTVDKQPIGGVPDGATAPMGIVPLCG